MERVIDQVFAILTKAGLKFDTRPDGKEYRVPYDSAFVFIRFQQQDEGEIFIHFSAPLLQEIDEKVCGRRAILEKLNALNCGIVIGRFCYYPDDRWVALEHGLYANDLQRDELLQTLGRVAGTAEQQDDLLLEAFGTGRRARDMLATAEAPEEVIDA